jgi:phage-related protein (TIGR01555 family)
MTKPLVKRNVSVAGAARTALAVDRKLRKAQDAARLKKTEDSFVNFQQMLGIGADNAMTTSTYGFNPISRIRILLEWIHRGSWLGGIAVDVKAEDMTREGVNLLGEITPEHAEQIEEAVTTLRIWKSLKETIQWSRLYGGSLAVMMIDGHDYSTPFRLEAVGKGDFKGLLVLDRWMVDPSLDNLVIEPGPDLGLPKFYRINAGGPAMPNIKIHHSRCIRLVGINLPYQQRLLENLWGISVLERLYDRMIAYDSTSTGAAQLVYKAWLRTYKIKGLRQIIGQGGKAYQGLVKQVDMMRRMAGQEGITLLDGEDEMEAMQNTTFSGLSDMLLQFGQQIAGALQIPLVRLLGQSPAGLNSTGDSDLRTYYDGVKKDQKAELGPGVTLIYRTVARSEGIALPDGFKTEFRSLWQLTEVEQSEIAERDGRTIGAAEESGLISQQTAMKELKKLSRITGRFSSITNDEIDDAEESLPPAGENAMGAVGGEALGTAAGEAKEGIAPGGEKAPLKKRDKPDKE